MASKDNDTRAQDASGSGRRQGDRREGSGTYTGPERRKHERRSGIDRRATRRDDGSGTAGE